MDERHRILDKIPIQGKKISQLEAEISIALAKAGLDISGFAHELHYQITEYEFKNDTMKSIQKKGVVHWERIRRMANEACLHLLGFVQSKKDKDMAASFRYKYIFRSQ